jgi:C_GCAxxG_C_C family probable redox protein
LSNHSGLARELFEKGYNCSQSVFAAFCDETGLDLETALKLASSFGGGMGRLREVCGAVTALFMIAGIKYGYTSPQNDGLKAEHYRRIQMLAEKFRAANGSYICRELLGLDGADHPIPERRTEKYYQTRPCSCLVEYAAELMDEFIKNEAVPE